MTGAGPEGAPPRGPASRGAGVTRRAALAGAATAALAAAAPARAAEKKPRRKTPVPPGEPAVLHALIGRENEAAAAYRAAAAADPRFARIARHENDHARALNSQLAALGLNGPMPLQDASGLRGEAGRLARATGRPAAFTAAIALERALIDAYDEAIRGLRIANVVRTAATVMGGHGRHLAVLEAERRR